MLAQLKIIGSKIYNNFHTGPMVGIVTLLIGIVTLWVLYRAYKVQRLQSFENKLFEMIKMHRENVAQFRFPQSTSDDALSNLSGRHVIKEIINKIIKILDKIDKYIDDIIKPEDPGSRELLKIKLAYYCVYYGYTPDDTDALRQALIDESKYYSFPLPSSFGQEKGLILKEGCQIILGHYFRHMYHIVDYINKQKFINKETKRYYVKLLRSQLSTDEQALLFLNSITPLGVDWWENKFMTEYKMVKNIPKSYFKKLKVAIDAYFQGEDTYFEHKDSDKDKLVFDKFLKKLNDYNLKQKSQ